MSRILPDAIFLDVDGVLIDSVALKGDVLAEVFIDIPNSAQRVREFHQTHGGLTRSLKIERLLEILRNESPTKAEVSERVNRFTEIIVDRVVCAPEIPGARRFLEEWSGRCPLYAVSATPEEEIQHIMVARGLRSYFSDVKGWPPGKSEHIAQRITLEGFRVSKCVLVGDSSEDYEAAKRASVSFIFFGTCRSRHQEGVEARIRSWSGFDKAVSEVLSPSKSVH